MTGRPWTRMEEEQLRVLRIAGLTRREMAAELRRTFSAVCSRLKLPRLRLQPYQRPRLTLRQEQWVWAFRNSDTNIGAATLMGATVRSAKRFRAILKAKGARVPSTKWGPGKKPRKKGQAA